MQCSFDINTYISRLKSGNINYQTDCPLSEMSTFRTGGDCAVAVFPQDKEQMCFAVKCTEGIDTRVRIIGRGSNILCSDCGFDGIIISTEEMTACSVEGTYIECDSGVSLSSVAITAKQSGLCMAEFMYGIPGTVGGGIYMNAGAYGGQMSDVVESVECFNMKTFEHFTLSADELDFSYRHSVFTSHPEYAVLSARMKLCEGDRAEIQAKMNDYITRRKEKQPLEYPSAGSTFKRCEGHYTSQLIDEAGLKGLTVGGAQVSEKHAGFVINRGGATSSDVLAVIELVKAKIKEKYNIDIECEVEYLE